MPGVKVNELKYGEIVETTEGLALLLRPVKEFKVNDDPLLPSQASINTTEGRQINLKAVQKLYYKDGERVKSVNGISLLTTQLVAEIDSVENIDTVSYTHLTLPTIYSV